MRHHASLIYQPDTPEERAYAFTEQIIVGRRSDRSNEMAGRVTIDDPTVSGRHCIVRQTLDGKFLIRDESRNGTKVRGRRLVPNVEVEIQPGDAISVTGRHCLRVAVDDAAIEVDVVHDYGETSALKVSETEVTIVVGDIAGYTTLNQRFDASAVVGPLGKVFAELEAVVNEHEGSIKEYQGDAIFAFWERDEADPKWHVLQACRAALALRDRVALIAGDRAVWTIPDFPLAMEWALTTGEVMIRAIGGDRPTGLAMVGDAVNYAFRLEKLAGEQTGTILACQTTRDRAEESFRFRSIGVHEVKGRSAEPVFALDGSLADTLPPRPVGTPPGG